MHRHQWDVISCSYLFLMESKEVLHEQVYKCSLCGEQMTKITQPLHTVPLMLMEGKGEDIND